MIAFDANVFVYATASLSDDKVTRAMQTGTAVLLLQTLAEFSYIGMRKAKIPPQKIRTTIAAWLAVLPVQAADDGDLLTALAVRG
jgi:predicted nucleic acid-binding protein